MTVSEPTANPVPVVIYCPACQSLHIDEGEWATRPHKTHQCQKCKLEWRPFPYATVGVASRKHYHKAMYDDLSGVLLEDCAICGESWRSTDVHISNPSVAEPKTLAANCSQIARAEPSRGAPSWSKMMAEMQPCGHTNAQHLYHDSGDIKIDLSACLVHTSIEHAGQTSGGTTADVAKAASAAPEPSRGAPDAHDERKHPPSDELLWKISRNLPEQLQPMYCSMSPVPLEEIRSLISSALQEVATDEYAQAYEFLNRSLGLAWQQVETLKSGHVVLLEALRMAHRYFLQSNKLTVDDREMLDEMWAAIKQAERT